MASSTHHVQEKSGNLLPGLTLRKLLNSTWKTDFTQYLTNLGILSRIGGFGKLGKAHIGRSLEKWTYVKVTVSSSVNCAEETFL